jgi:hypothetical protein
MQKCNSSDFSIFPKIPYTTFKKYGLNTLAFNFVKKVKQSRYRPGVAQRVPGS